MANGVHYWFSNLPCVRENGEWAVAAAVYGMKFSHELFVDASFFFFSFAAESFLRAHTIYEKCIYIVFVDDAFDVWCVADKSTITQIYYIWYQNKSNAYIEIASPNHYYMKNARRNFVSKFFYAMPQITFNSIQFYFNRAEWNVPHIIMCSLLLFFSSAGVCCCCHSWYRFCFCCCCCRC